MSDLDIEIKFEDDNTLITKTTNSNGEISFRHRYDFDSSSIRNLWNSILRTRKNKGYILLWNIKRNKSQINRNKERLRIESITPQKPKIGERITMTISVDDYSRVLFMGWGPWNKKFFSKQQHHIFHPWKKPGYIK